MKPGFSSMSSSCVDLVFVIRFIGIINNGFITDPKVFGTIPTPTFGISFGDGSTDVTFEFFPNPMFLLDGADID